MKIAICDDNADSRKAVVDCLKNYSLRGVDVSCDEFESGEALLNHKDGDFFDIVFLDIEMSGLNGVETARRLRESGNDAIVIFVTSHANFVPDAFRVGAFQFLTKPIRQNDFDKDFSRALEHYRAGRHLYKVPHNAEGVAALEIKDIIFMEGYNKRLSLHTSQKTYSFSGKLTDEEKRLRDCHFVLCHQGYLVNMAYIGIIGSDSIMLTNGKEVPMSKHRKTEVLARFNDYLARLSV